MQVRGLERVTLTPGIMGGKPCVAGRVPVSAVVNLLASGMTNQEIREEFPYLAVEDIQQALRYAALSVDDEVLPL